MKFEIFNERGIVVMNTTTPSCMPSNEDLKSMSSYGYKFKLDGKAISVKNLIKKIKESTNG